MVGQATETPVAQHRIELGIRQVLICEPDCDPMAFPPKVGRTNGCLFAIHRTLVSSVVSMIFSFNADRLALANISVAAAQRLGRHRVGLGHGSVEVGDSLAGWATG